MWINSKGEVHGGEAMPGDIAITSRPSGDHILSPEWRSRVPNVWDFDLAGLKNRRTAEIDSRTQDLIAAGFSYGNKNFSLSLEAQAKLMIINNLAAAGFLDPKTPLSTRDNALYELKRADAVEFVGTAYGRLSAIVIAGSILKGSVMAAATKEVVDLIVDSRT